MFIPIINGNPIPVYPDLEPTYHGSPSFHNLNIAWILGVFAIDFFLDILIVYGGLIILYQYNLFSNKNIFNFSKKIFFSSVFIISLIGLITELILGPWILGFLLALFFIFASFVIVTKYFLDLNWINGVRMGLIAVVINVIFWIIIFSL
jgi:hypothetical protein